MMGLRRKASLPRFYHFGGGPIRKVWAFGWLTGGDSDLVCVKPNILVGLPLVELLLSPVCSTRFLSLFGFLLKVLLVRIDRNAEL